MNLNKYKNKKVLIMGLGVHGGGVAAAKFFAELDSKVTITDLKPESELLISLEKLKTFSNIKYVLGMHNEEDFKNADLIIRNPGVPKDSKFLKVAYDVGVEVQMQEGIFFQNCPSKNIIGVTGTKGKTTTAHLLYECLNANGLKTHLAGNMRKPVLDILYEIKLNDWVVLELSSWQCESLDDNKISPHIAIVTNISEDHLNRYSSYKDYALSKSSIFKYQTKNDLCFLNKDIEFLEDYKKICSSKLFEVNLNSSNKIILKNLDEFKLKGEHNVKNIKMVLEVCEKLNLDLETCIKAVKSFNGVPYRLEKIGDINGVDFINDSAATTTAAVFSAIEAYKSVRPVLILGGADKNLDYTNLVKQILDLKLKYVLLKGTATEKLIELGLDKNLIFDNFYNAINKAYSLAKMENGVVLLSPGAASFGMFKHEFDRGDKFKNIFVELKIKYENLGFVIDSRKANPDSVFVCYKGAVSDGHFYIESAIKNGATFIVGERSPEEIECLKTYREVKYLQIENGRELFAELCAQQYGFPQNKLKIIGVTGTDGKTTTSTFIYNILKSANKKVGLISTVAAYYNDKDISTGLHTTTPDSDLLFKILRDMVDDGVEYLVLEITSHALIQKRVHGLRLIASTVTNISPEHLDAHGTYEQLIKDKAKIFNISDKAFLNKKGMGFEKIKQYVPQDLEVTEVDMDDINFTLPEDFKLKYPGDYNLQNVALAVSIGRSLNINEEDIRKGIKSTIPPTGRFERVKNKKGVNLIVDFAHTENSMKSVLSTVREIKKENEKIIVVFGCAGERDTQKRSKMGKTSSELADIIILTAEDPRSEEVEDIMNQISSGNTNYPFIKIADRMEAIKKSYELANPNDWVLILGKGHEQSMNFKGVEKDWSDIDAAKTIFNINDIKVCLDSRLVQPGEYFVPVVGENFDGHDFISAALERGATGILEEDELYKIASQKLARINPKVIAITGSVGKSTMREFVRVILSEKFSSPNKICVGDLNTKLGLATNIINSMDDDCEVFIAECGMDHPGELLETGKFIVPDVAIITNISESHLEKLGSLENIKKAKMELTQNLKPNGVVILNWDNLNIRDAIKYIPNNLKIIKYGIESKDVDFKDNIFENIKFNFVGLHNYLNALGAVVVSLQVGMKINSIKAALVNLETPKGRLKIIKGINNSILVDDTYNSSPVSCVSAIESVSKYFLSQKLNGRKIAIIGGMLELGDFSDEGHKKVGESLLKEKFDVIVLVGELAKKINKENNLKNVHYCENNIDAGTYTREQIKPNSKDIILIKGSQGIRLEKVVKALMQNPEDADKLLVRQDSRWN